MASCRPLSESARLAHQEFNKFDLYSKSDDVPSFEEHKPYYEGLLKKYGIDGKLKF